MGQMKTVGLVLLASLVVTALMTPSTDAQATTDTCTAAGYFKSCCIPNGYYYCINSGGRWLIYNLTCSPGYEYNQSTQKCVLATGTTTTTTAGTTTTTTAGTTTTTTTTTTVAPGGPGDGGGGDPTDPVNPGDPTDPDPEDPTG